MTDFVHASPTTFERPFGTSLAPSSLFYELLEDLHRTDHEGRTPTPSKVAAPPQPVQNFDSHSHEQLLKFTHQLLRVHVQIFGVLSRSKKLRSHTCVHGEGSSRIAGSAAWLPPGRPSFAFFFQFSPWPKSKKPCSPRSKTCVHIIIMQVLPQFTNAHSHLNRPSCRFKQANPFPCIGGFCLSTTFPSTTSYNIHHVVCSVNRDLLAYIPHKHHLCQLSPLNMLDLAWIAKPPRRRPRSSSIFTKPELQQSRLSSRSTLSELRGSVSVQRGGGSVSLRESD